MNKLHCLIINLGSPASPKENDVATYLRQFLMDKSVMRMPWLFRAFLVNCIIIPRRKKHSSDLYSQVWSNGKSPLVYNTEKLTEKVSLKLKDKGCDIGISFAMRYGCYSIEDKIKELSERGIKKLLVIPMFPQYEKSTYQNVIDEAARCAKSHNIDTFSIPPFYEHCDYLAAVQRSMREGLNGIVIDKLIFSFHGIPLDYLPCGEKNAKQCDNKSPNMLTSDCAMCYKYQCLVTAKKASESIGAKDEDYSVSFQSRLGHKEWLSPSLPTKLRESIKDGNVNVGVVSPSFTADCVETLHEIDIEAREEFMDAGGESFHYIPAINDLDLWAKKVTKWIIEWGKI